MSKIQTAFANGKAFIPFVTCGDPSLEVTEQIVYAMADAGADLIELGIPFSDPTAEGPVIQEANVRALSAGTTTDKIFDMVRRIRQKTDIPMVFMTYANVVIPTARSASSAPQQRSAWTVLSCRMYRSKKRQSSIRSAVSTVWISCRSSRRPRMTAFA